MNQPAALSESSLSALPLLARGKVRDLYEVDADHLLIVTTDRLSAFDVILPDPVPGKGEILTRISNFWFAKMVDLAPNHLTERRLESIIDDPEERAPLEQRSIVVKRLQPLPIEAVVRGYLIGSGWNDYLSTGHVCGVRLPTGLKQACKLEAPLFTPATKATVGDHDENISFADTEALVGASTAAQVRDITLQIYRRAADYALRRGIIIADTKLEFGKDNNGRLYVIDEMLTPDSSRFWPLDAYRPGTSPPSYDKQFVRDYLNTLDWDKRAPGPSLPADVLSLTRDKYQEAWRKLTAATDAE